MEWKRRIKRVGKKDNRDIWRKTVKVTGGKSNREISNKEIGQIETEKRHKRIKPHLEYLVPEKDEDKMRSFRNI